uniref:Uncharacterized protein n=1 Tax=Anguilla anguilla TaxID=7936 RepID=A0A0E9RBE8_ANGAN
MPGFLPPKIPFACSTSIYQYINFNQYVSSVLLLKRGLST